MYTINQITKNMEFKLIMIYQESLSKLKHSQDQTTHTSIKEEAFKKFKHFFYEHGNTEMKNYTEKQLRDIYFKRKYTIFSPGYNIDDGLDYQCAVNSL